MKISSFKKIEKICYISLICMVLIFIGLLIVWFSFYNHSDDGQKKVENPIENSKTEKSTLTEKIDVTPSKCNLNEKLADFSFTKEGTDKLTLFSMHGKVVVLTFWASWCPYCKKDLEQSVQIKTMLEKYKDVDYWLVDKLDNSKETKNTALAYLKEKEIPLRTVFDENLQVYKQLGLKIVPTTLVIDKNGILRAWHMGGDLNVDDLESMINDAQKG